MPPTLEKVLASAEQDAREMLAACDDHNSHAAGVYVGQLELIRDLRKFLAGQTDD